MCLLCLCTAPWWHGNACPHTFCLLAPSPGDMGSLICAPDMSQRHHMASWECLFISSLCPALPCGSTDSVPAMLHRVSQYGHAYSYTCCVQVMPRGCVGRLVCMPALSQHHQMAVWTHLFMCLLCPHDAIWWPDCMPSLFKPTPPGGVSSPLCTIIGHSTMFTWQKTCACLLVGCVPVLPGDSMACHVPVPPYGFQHTLMHP